MNKCKALIILKPLMKEMERRNKKKQKKYKRNLKISKKGPKQNKFTHKKFKMKKLIVHNNKIILMIQNLH